MDNNILVIGIAGGTGSGKTTLMNNLIETFREDVTLLSHDNYYKRHDDLTYEERCRLNYDEPAALETDLMAVHLDKLRHGVEIDGRMTAPCEVTILTQEEGRVVLEFLLYEGRNRQIRKMCDAVGLEVARLKRTAVGSLKLGMLGQGKYRELSEQEIKKLLRSAGHSAQ